MLVRLDSPGDGHSCPVVVDVGVRLVGLQTDISSSGAELEVPVKISRVMLSRKVGDHHLKPDSR